ncbi:MAG: hypothetical protein AAFV95_02515 [Bacteroidota bacterium]
MRSFVLLAVLLCQSWMLFGQDDYTYISDRRFPDPSDLIGYNFVPSSMEIPNEMEAELDPGEYSFGISRNNLYVAGGEIKGVYNVNNINPTEYGYILRLINARNPTLQGHLKVILTPQAQVEALVFRRSRNDQEIIFFQTEADKELKEEEAGYFTDRWEVPLESPDSLWGMVVYPFLRIHEDVSGEQERLQMEDSTSIQFVETIRVIEKVKKKRKKKKKKKKEKMENIELGITEEEAEEPAAEALAEESEAPLLDSLGQPIDSSRQDVRIKTKIVKEYFIEIRSILTYDDDTQEDKEWRFPIKKIVEREDEEASGNAERYQLEIATEKGGIVYLYLTPKRTVSSIEVMGKRYLMQGF